jgi:alpha-tubulin suppressor-like RCC1 family protein
MSVAGLYGQRRSSPARTALILGALLALVAALLSFQAEQPARAALSALAGKTVTQVSTGASHTCAVTSDGQLACWGLNTNGQLGNGTVLNRSVPTFVTTVGTPFAGKTIIQVSAGTSHTCAVTSDGILACWGLQTTGRLGNGLTTADNVQLPTAVTLAGTPLVGKTISAVTAGGSHTCAVATDGTPACWGSNGNGRLGDGTTTTRSIPSAITTAGTPLAGGTIATLVAGGSHTCARTVAGVMACWGLNSNGQLGDATVTQRTIPTAVATATTVLNGLVIADLTVGASHTCALSTTGVAACWGLQTNGRLGNNLTTAANITTPVALTITGTPLAGKAVVRLTAGGAHTCALTLDALTACWGSNTNGRLGDGTTTQRAVPTAIATATTPLATRTIASLAAGGSHTCGVANDGLVVCWGLNSSNQIGDGTTTQRTRAVAVITVPTFTIASITGQRTGVLAYARAGDQINLTGSWWSPSIAAGGFVVTVGGATAANTLSTDASGALTGAVTVPAGATAGAGTIVVTQATDVVTGSINVLGTRTVAVIPVSGGIPTTVSVTAQRFDPTAAVEIRGVTNLTGPVDSGDPIVTGSISSAGSLSSVSYTINDPATVAVVVRETGPGGNPATDFATADVAVDPVLSTITSIAGQRSGVVGYARGGDALSVSGTGWASSLTSSAFTVALCDNVGTGCDAATTTTLSTNASGDLSGTIAVPAGATVGERGVKITQGLRSTLIRVTVLGDRVVSLVPVSGGAGTSIAVTGSNFDPTADLTIQGVRAADGSTVSSDAPVSAAATTSGAMPSTAYTVIDPLTVAVMVVEAAPEGNPATDRAFGTYTVLPVVAVIDQVTGQRTGINSHARSGDSLVMSGSNWAPNLAAADLTVRLCTVDGVVCDPAATDTLVTNGNGDLSGAVVVSASAATGDRSVKVTSVNGESLTPLTVLGERAISVSSSSIVLGGSVDVSGTDFDVSADAFVRGATAVGNGTVTYSSDPSVALITDPSGNAEPVAYAVNDSATTFLVIAETDPGGNPLVDRATTAFAVRVPTFSLGLRSFATGSNPDPNTVSFGSIESPVAPAVVTGDLNRLQVVDDRNGSFGWALTASLSDFTGTGGATMSRSALVASPLCSSTPDSAPGFVSGGPNQNFSGLVQLCSKDAQTGTGGTTSGTYTIDADLILTVPAFQAADSYTAVLTVTLA